MKLSSLHVRLSLAAAVSILVALTLSGLFLSVIFERHVVRRVDKELSVFIKQLAANVEESAGGTFLLANPLADDRFRRPLSGLYWQVEAERGVVLRSRSLWNSSLSLPAFDASASAPARLETTGPNGETLVVRSRLIFLEVPGGDHALRLSAAVDKNEIVSARDAFTRDLMMALGGLGAVLLVASWLQIFVGLRPLKQIRQRINEIRTGEEPKLKGDYPPEVGMLVDEVNALIAANDQAVQRARDSAADLAHGLKTPLAILHAESRTLAEQQQEGSAEEISAQVEQMRQRIEQHLAVVRIRGASRGAPGRTNVKGSLEKIVNAMKAMPRGDEIYWRLDIPDALTVSLDRQDFFEVFGNLLDNARKWAKSDVVISGSVKDDVVCITVSDDGPGVPADKLTDLVERGTRLDEQKTGAGLGLSIARKTLRSYDGDLAMENAGNGGVRVTVLIPSFLRQT